MCVFMHVVLGGRKLRELSCLVFVCCTQLPPGCYSRGYGSLSSRWQNSLTQGEVCVLSLCVTNHTHTQLMLDAEGELAASGSVGS